MTILSASQLKLFYGEVEIFSGIALEVYERARIGLVGPNGGGKTTLIRTLIGELTANGGSVARVRSFGSTRAEQPVHSPLVDASSRFPERASGFARPPPSALPLPEAVEAALLATLERIEAGLPKRTQWS